MSEKRARGEGSLYQPKTSRFIWAACSYHGRKIRFSTGETDWKKAGTVLRKRLAEFSTGIRKPSGHIMFADLRDSLLADYGLNARRSLRFNKQGKPYLDKLDRLKFFERFRADEIDADLIRRYQREQQAKGLSNASINRSVSALRRSFNLAIEDGRLSSAPYFPMLPEAKPRSGFIETDEYEKLAAELPAHLRIILALGFFTGMRLGEITRLEWKQVDFIADTIRLRTGETKSGQGRVVPLVPELRAALLAARNDSPFVCVKDGARVQSFRKAWKSATKRAGLDGLLVHDLRRSAVRALVRSGVAEKIAMQISGHLTRSVFDRYNIVSENDVMDAGRKLAEYHAEAKRQLSENGHTADTLCTRMQQPKSAVN